MGKLAWKSGFPCCCSPSM